MTITIEFDREFQEYRVPTLLGVTGKDQLYFTDDKQDAIDTARLNHGSDVAITFRRIN